MIAGEKHSESGIKWMIAIRLTSPSVFIQIAYGGSRIRLCFSDSINKGNQREREQVVIMVFSVQYLGRTGPYQLAALRIAQYIYTYKVLVLCLGLSRPI